MTLTIHYRLRKGAEREFRSSGGNIITGRPKDVIVKHRQQESAFLDLSPDTKVSRKHARMFYELSGWWVEDLKSRHGTFLNGKRITEAIQLSPGDLLVMGDTRLRVEFVSAEAEPESGAIESRFEVDEILPPLSISEDRRLEIFAAITNVAAYSKTKQAMLEGFLREIAAAFPQAERRTILLIEGSELVPCAFWPTNQSYVSFTLARQAIKSHQTLLWLRKATVDPDAPLSLLGAQSAVYAPMLSGGQVTGVIHIDSASSEAAFDKSDQELLGLIANTAGSAVRAGGDDAASKIPSIFVSYAHEDRPFVDRLAADLRRRRVKVWFDEHLKSGDAWRSQLLAAIRVMNAFVLVMSIQSSASEYVRWELETALSLSKKVFPLMYQKSDAPEPIRDIQYINIGTNYGDAIDELVGRLYELNES